MSQPPDALFTPQVRLAGEVNDDMFAGFQEAFREACQGPDPVVVELTTVGGDADVGRRIAADVRLFRQHSGRNPLLFGKTVVYSAGATILSGFRREDRWLDRECVLMIHGRKLAKTMDFSRALDAERDVVEALLSEIDIGLKVQGWGFEALIEGSDVTLDELKERARQNWYLDADDALKRRLVAGVV